MAALNHQPEKIRTPRGNLFELHYDSGKTCYFVEGPVLGGNVIPVQGVRIRVEALELDTEKAMAELLDQLAERGY